MNFGNMMMEMYQKRSENCQSVQNTMVFYSLCMVVRPAIVKCQKV